MSLEVSILSGHKLFRKREDVPQDNTAKFTNLLTYSSDRIFTWDHSDDTIHVVNVKNCVRDKDLKSQVIFDLSPNILFKVDNLEPSPSCTLLAVSGKNGLAVVKLPERWSNIQRTTLTYTSICQRLFLGEQHELRQLKWHPGSPSDSHLVILTSDETLRCYNLTDGELLWKCILSKKIPSYIRGSKVALGDTPVSFDFAPPPFEEDLLQIKWPILVLWGHGDVYSVVSSLNKEKPSLSGPLRMYPPSDDNYGTDASTILVLNTSPPIVVLSTCTGTLYHCLLMSAEEPETSNDKSLYVFECVELNIGLTIEEDDVISTKISLVKDSVEASRYFCIHDAGVHSVTVPLVSKLHEFENDDDFGVYKSSSVVDYLLCTGISTDDGLYSSPVNGFAFIDLSMSLVVLLQNNTLINVKLVPKTLHSVEALSVERSKTDSDGFLFMIENSLNQNGVGTLAPIVKLPEITPQAWFEIVMKNSEYCRKVLKVHESVAGLIAERASSIRASMSTELIQIDQLTRYRASLQETAEIIADRYEELNDKQNSLMSRVEDIMKATYTQDPKLSHKEKETLNYLNGLNTKLEKYEKDLSRVKATQKYQASISKDVGTLLDNKNFYLDDSRAKTIRQELGTLSTEINDLAKRMKNTWGALRESGLYK